MRDDLREFGVRHPRHVDLHERALDREVLCDQLLDVVRDPDEHDGRVGKLVRERLDRVREEQSVVARRKPVELVDEDHDPASGCERLQPAPDVVRRRIVGQQRRRAHAHVPRLTGEADSGTCDGELELAECLSPDALVVVAPVARRPGGHDAGRGEHLGRHADERGLADPTLAVDDRVLTRLLGHGEEIAELTRPPGEEAPAIDRRSRAERLGQRLEASDLLRLASFQLPAHPPSIVRRDRPKDNGA